MGVTSQQYLQFWRMGVRDACATLEVDGGDSSILWNVNTLLADYKQGTAEITPTFWRSIKIKRNKVHKKILLFVKSTYDAIFFKHF